ncbi:MAG: SdpI family protein [Clostridiales bacterium]|nr:SdpI family protein [Clostridiales bacterium]
MAFWWPSFVFSLIVPAFAIIAGRLMWKRCPSEISYWIGYRTKRSMKSKDTWKFAHEYFGRLWWIVGWAVCLPLGLAMIPFIACTESTIRIALAIIVGVQIIVLIAMIIPTEIALEKNFNIDGTRK